MELIDCLNYMHKHYNIHEQYMWTQYPTTSVLIEPHSQQWVAILLREWDEQFGELIQAIDIKVGKDYLSDVLFDAPEGFGHAHRMNTTEWLGVTLNLVSYDQEDVLYAALDEAVARAQMSNIVIIGDIDQALQRKSDTPADSALSIPPRNTRTQSRAPQTMPLQSQTKPSSGSSIPTPQNTTPNSEHDSFDGILSTLFDFNEENNASNTLQAQHTLQAQQPLQQNYGQPVVDPTEQYLASIVKHPRKKSSHSQRVRAFTKAAFALRDFVDDVKPWKTSMYSSASYVSYSLLSMQELRQYFTWRAALRKGTYIKAPTMFESLVCAEYFLGIGADSPQEVIDLVHKLIKASEASIDVVHSYGDAFRRFFHNDMRRWLHDYCIIQGLPQQAREELGDSSQFTEDEQMHVLIHCNDDPRVTDEQIVNALIAFCDTLEDSPLLRKKKDLALPALANLWRHCINLPVPQQLQKHEERSLAEVIFGTKKRSAWYPLTDLMIDINPTEPMVVDFDSERRFEFDGKKWSVLGYFLTFRHSVLLALVREIDGVLRKQFKTGGYLRSPSEPWLQRIVQQAQEAIAAEEQRARLPQIDISANTLHRIREDALASQESLLTEDERLESADPTEIPDTADTLGVPEQYELPEASQEVSATHTPNAHSAASDDEVSASTSASATHPYADILQLLLDDPTGQQATQAIINNHQLPSVVADAINEAYWNTIGDSLVEYNGSVLTMIEDYVDDLQALL